MTPFWRSCRRFDYAENTHDLVPAPLPFTGSARHNPELGIRPDKRVIRPEPNQRQPQFGKTTTVSGMI
jgi:hypothetical protein